MLMVCPQAATAGKERQNALTDKICPSLSQPLCGSVPGLVHGRDSPSAPGWQRCLPAGELSRGKLQSMLLLFQGAGRMGASTVP